jgi:hypothetical protein
VRKDAEVHIVFPRGAWERGKKRFILFLDGWEEGMVVAGWKNQYHTFSIPDI